MKALLIVDLQNDFLPGGPLAAPEGNRIISIVNHLIDCSPLTIASKDWHPEQTIHFDRWPVHCVAKTSGSDFPKALHSQSIGCIIQKGTSNSDDGYSAFEATSIELNDYLKDKNITDLYICGLTTEYCVKQTVLDALNHKYNTFVIQDAVAGVKAHPGDEQKAWEDMQKAGAQLILSSEFLKNH